MLVLLRHTLTQDSSVTATECNTYTGEICQTALLARQSCIPGREDSTEVSVALTSSLQTVVERQFALLPMSDTPNSTCERELLSFLCVEAFAGLCDDNGTVHRTTRRECERVTSTVCAAEFLPQLKANGFALSCDTFPTSSSICTTTTSKLNYCTYNTLHDQVYNRFFHTSTIVPPIISCMVSI